MRSARLPARLTAAVLRAVTDAARRAMDAWEAAEQRGASSRELADLQAVWEQADATYRAAMDRADREGVADVTIPAL